MSRKRSDTFALRPFGQCLASSLRGVAMSAKAKLMWLGLGRIWLPTRAKLDPVSGDLGRSSTDADHDQVWPDIRRRFGPMSADIGSMSGKAGGTSAKSGPSDVAGRRLLRGARWATRRVVRWERAGRRRIGMNLTSVRRGGHGVIGRAAEGQPPNLRGSVSVPDSRLGARSMSNIWWSPAEIWPETERALGTPLVGHRGSTVLADC